MLAVPAKNSLRVDVWIWRVRAYKTRSSSKNACLSNNVRVNGEVVKPATKVLVGDLVEVKKRDELVKYEVIGLPVRRVGADLVLNYYVVNEKVSLRKPSSGPTAPGAIRERGSGRPTKKERRSLDKLKGIRKR